VQQIADAAHRVRARDRPLGRSMKNNVAMAREMGVLHIPDSTLIDIEDIGDYDPARSA
jgi:ribonuclease J